MKVVGLAICAALVAGATAAMAAKVYPTQIAVTGTGSSSQPGSFDFSASGYLQSERARCIRARTVKLLFETGGETQVVDIGSSSENGAWAVRAHSTSAPDSELVRVTRRRFGRRHHRKVCGGATKQIMGFPGPP